MYPNDWILKNWGSIDNFENQFDLIYEDSTVLVFIAERETGIVDVCVIGQGNNCLYLKGFDHVYTPYGEL
jgi:hypothetical protein